MGSVVAAAAGDALGAPYEFLAPIPASDDVEMTGGGVLGWGEGEWTDDTAMAIVVLEAAATAPGHELRIDSTQDQIAREWYSWSIGTPDIGHLTAQVLRRAERIAMSAGHSVPRAVDLRDAAQQTSEELPESAGNGALMRTHVVVLAYLDAPDEVLAGAVLEIAQLTHRDPEVDDACLLWSFAVRHAIRTGLLDVRAGIRHLDEDRQAVWEERIVEAESLPPSRFGRNGWVVQALQAAWSAIHAAGPIPEDRFAQREHMTRALEAAVRGGYDTDTVACITGALLGAVLGPKSVPPEWRRVLFGWPGYEVEELMRLVDQVLPEAGPLPETGS